MITAEEFEEAKSQLLTDVLAQVEGLIATHKTQSAAEIARYRNEAERARQNLQQLREVIQQDGLELQLAPALVEFQRRQARLQRQRAQRAKDAGGSAGGDEPDVGDDDDAPLTAATATLSLALGADAERMLEVISEELLLQLLSLGDTKDVPSAVRRAVRDAFDGLVAHFAEELSVNARGAEESVAALQRELDDAREGMRTMQLAFDAYRVQCEADRQHETSALRDEIRVLLHQTAGPAGGMTGGAAHVAGQTMQERAFEEYAQLLADARRECDAQRQQAEAERTHSAEVCLRLKAALQRRSEEFERAVVARAEDVVAERDRRITELEEKLNVVSGTSRAFRSVMCQAGEPAVHVPTADTFVPSLLSSMGKARGVFAPAPRPDAAVPSDAFERGVWRKTQELLHKYATSS
jgi:hypothetical protein